MTGSYLLYNELHCNGLMTDLGLIRCFLSFTAQYLSVTTEILRNPIIRNEWLMLRSYKTLRLSYEIEATHDAQQLATTPQRLTTMS